MALEKEKFRKVWKLAVEGATKGERDAATQAARTLAKKAGLTLAKAKVVANEPDPAPRPTSMFEAFFNDPWWKAENEKRERERLAKCAELLKVYGTREAVFAETDLERAMREACEPLATWRDWFNEDTQRNEPYLYDVAGWGFDDSEKDMPTVVREAVSSASPLPSSVLEAWQEYDALDGRSTHRWIFDRDYRRPIWNAAREYVVEAILWSMPARSMADILARLEWSRRLAERGLLQYRDEEFVDLMRADLLAYHERASGFLEAALQAINNLERRTREAGFDSAVAVLTAARESGIERKA